MWTQGILRGMKRSLIACALATAAVLAGGCAAPQVPAASGGTSTGNVAFPSPLQSTASSAATKAAATSPGTVAAAAPSSTRVSPTKAPSTSTASSSAAAAGFLRLARTAYPAKSTAVLEQNGRAICTALRKDASVHDEVGMMAGQLDNQAMANQIVQAAIGAYCPDLKR